MNKFNPDIHHRRSIRLTEYDYSKEGAYFVTICLKDRACLFGKITDCEMDINDAGAMVKKAWEELPARFPAIQTDQLIVMPNHIHGIILTEEATTTKEPPTLAAIMGAFKSITTDEYICGVKQSGWPSFSGKLWQRNYFEHIIRNDESLNKIREYIKYNPNKWEEDPENPRNCD